jgi:HlyD family secretion protein
MKARTKWIIAALVVVGGGGAAAAVASQRGPKPIEVRVETVEPRDLVASVTASGKVQPRTKADLSADITGRITRLSVKEGDEVREGQFLLQIDPQQFEAAVQRSEGALAEARASFAQARANAIQSERNFKRSEEVRKANPQLISDEALELARTQMEVNQALLEAAEYRTKQAEAGLRDARWQLERTTIRSPMTGRITRLNVEVGETAIMGTLNRDAATLMTISDMSVLQTKVKVDETDVVRISLGDSTVVQLDAFPDTTFRGKVVEVSNSSIQRAGTTAGGDQAVDFEVTIELLDAPTETRPDLSATAKIVTSTRTQVLSIPIIALTVREDSAFVRTDAPAAAGGGSAPRAVGKRDIEGVFIVGADNTVSFRPVKVGIAGDRFFEVLSGLERGERIVGGTYQAIRELKDGAAIKEAIVASPGGTSKSPTP